MSGPAHVSDPTVLYLHQLLDELAKGYLQIPRFQRSFVWDDDQRLELLRSIRDGIPIGAILVWRTSLTSLQTSRGIGPHDLPEPMPSPTSSRTYLLDGMQRLSTAYGCLHPLLHDRSPFVQSEGREVSWLVGYDLASEEFEILSGRDGAPAPTWLPLTHLRDSVRLIQFQRGLSRLPDAEMLIQRADALAETFRTYKVPVVPFVTDDLRAATRAFERINRWGTPMSELHMVRALTWTERFDLEHQLARVSSRLEGVGWESLEPEWIFKVCKVALDVDISLASAERSSLSITQHPAVFAEVAESLLAVAAWLGQHCGVWSPRIVPYRMQIVMLAEALRLRPEPDPTTTLRLVQWFWLTTYTEKFSGITGGQTNAMLASVRRCAMGGPFETTGTWREPNLSVPPTFNQNRVSVKRFALRLAALKPLDVDGTEIDASQQLAREGPRALVSVVPESSACAARMFAGSSRQLRWLLLPSLVTTLSQPVLTSHAITPEAVAALERGDYLAFQELRSVEIERLERDFFDKTQRLIE